MINKKLEEIKESDLIALINDSVQEGKTIEYKAILKIGKDADRKEFLADVSSFANASGGDLIFGISEKNGLPFELTGVEMEDADSMILKIEGMIREGIEPRLPSVSTAHIRLSNGNVCIIIRVGKSWISPHRVVFKSHDKFYTRSSNGKYPMDVSELRVAFNLTDTITEKIQKFRETRISNIIAGETPVTMDEGAKTVLHLIPLISFNPGQRIDVENSDQLSLILRPLCSGGWNDRFNFDGYMTYHSSTRDENPTGYVQLFRNGIIEAVDSDMLEPTDDRKLIRSVAYEKEIIHGYSKYQEALQKLFVEPPILIFLTITGVKGYELYADPMRRFTTGHKIDRDVLYLPDVLLENYDLEPQTILKPVFDSVWNACGYKRSFNYSENGEWKPQ